jgi:HSP20 family molecular chaperone IbpA
MTAEMPGVTQDDIKVDLDANVLSIEATPSVPKDLGESILQEFNLATYRRVFELKRDIDKEKISADLKNGVLTLTLPKSEAEKPRQIPVSAS